MAVECIHCGDEIDIGTIGHDEPDGAVHLTIAARRGFGTKGGFGRLHLECADDLGLDLDGDPLEWRDHDRGDDR